MLFNTNYLALILCISTFSSALPLDGALNPRANVPRAKSYSIVNVDGGSTSAPPPEATTTVVEEKTKTKTVHITAIVPTITSIVSTILADPTPAPEPTPSSSSSSSSAPTLSLASSSQIPIATPSSTPQPTPSSSEQPTETAKPSIVTVIISKPATVVVTASAGPTEYYDNGLWHTSYVIKSFAVAAVATQSV